MLSKQVCRTIYSLASKNASMSKRKIFVRGTSFRMHMWLRDRAMSAVEAARLSREFDELFGTRTGYWQLVERIEKTQG